MTNSHGNTTGSPLPSMLNYPDTDENEIHYSINFNKNGIRFKNIGGSMPTPTPDPTSPTFESSLLVIDNTKAGYFHDFQQTGKIEWDSWKRFQSDTTASSLIEIGVNNQNFTLSPGFIYELIGSLNCGVIRSGNANTKRELQTHWSLQNGDERIGSIRTMSATNNQAGETEFTGPAHAYVSVPKDSPATTVYMGYKTDAYDVISGAPQSDQWVPLDLDVGSYAIVKVVSEIK